MNYKHILVALELSDESHVLIDKAVFLAKLLDARISFIHIDGTHGEIYHELVDMKVEGAQRPLSVNAMEQLQEFESYMDYPLRSFLVGTGDLGDKIHETVVDHNVDLLICGHHQDFWSKIISYSRHLIHKSPVDILVVPIATD
ncbi:universal stress protein [Vibrio astriarenae]|jgi:nucleotide-binding universal stress UspA family protein|uniref:Universal stress protein n=1 Tax=Vibrio agarivorans TaxID=153622 RepID=A0ABT7XWK0_9VIBR|nr:universal stress protein [Vibrio agarivorans]MDN2480120.1 universal stress protein [Vibrio agarivorans]